jgi:hypothetical protein
MVTAIQLIPCLDTVTDNRNAALGAAGGQLVNGAFKTIESVGPSVQMDLECAVVVIAAGFAFGHRALLKVSGQSVLIAVAWL